MQGLLVFAFFLIIKLSDQDFIINQITLKQ
jgi:hypothetical protein